MKQSHSHSHTGDSGRSLQVSKDDSQRANKGRTNLVSRSAHDRDSLEIALMNHHQITKDDLKSLEVSHICMVGADVSAHMLKEIES